MTVIVEGATDGQAADTGAAGGAEFASGVAAATAASAADDAQAALVVAEEAEQRADYALDSAGEAQSAAWDAQAEIAGVRDEMRAGFATVADALAALAVQGAPAGDDVAPAPAAKAKATAAEDTDDVIEATGGKPQKKKSLWWGERG